MSTELDQRHRLQFNCISCEASVCFSVLDSEQFHSLCCINCGRKYLFDDETLVQQLYQFEALCRQIQASKAILGKAAIAVDIANHHVRVPFNLLLTRLSSVIDLNMNGKKITIAFRVEPLRDCEQDENL